VRTALRVEALEERGDTVAVRTREARAHYDHVICAVSAHNAAALLSAFDALAATAAMLQRLRYQPIYSIYLQFEDAVRLPAPMLGLQGVAQWVFDREAICGQRGSIGAVISAEGPHQNVGQDVLAAQVHRQIERELGPLPPLAWHRVIAEKRATFECAVDTERPSTRTPLRNVHLAGDYTAGDFPATLEAAVRSGIAAANQVLEAARVGNSAVPLR
jgi:predicted NAD/FAD-dependent oxidoreductase